MSDNLTIVVFLNTKSKYDINRFNNTFMPSFRKLKANFLLVIPEFNSDLKIDNNYHIFYDRIVITNLKCEGYTRQLLLKLYISHLIKTEFYLILDIDVILNKPFKLSDIFYDEKIILHIWNGIIYTDKKQYLKEYNTTWIIDSSRVLGIDLKSIPNPFNYSVTPALLITKEVRNLLVFLDKKYFCFSDYFATNSNCGTEYGLYYLFIKDKGLYLEHSENMVDAIWFKKDLNKIYELDNNSIFWVIQSSTTISNGELLQHKKIKIAVEN